MTSVVIAHVAEDEALARRLASRLQLKGIDSSCLNTDKEAFDLNSHTGTECAVILLSESSVRARSFTQFLKHADKQSVRWVPVRSGSVEISRQLGFYLQIVQWLDVDKEDEQQIKELATAILNKDPSLAAQIRIPQAKRKVAILAGAISVVLLASISLGIILWQRSDRLGSRQDEIAENAAPTSSGPMVYAYVSDDGEIPWFNPDGGVLNVSLTVPDIQTQDVGASYFQEEGGGLNLLGTWSGIPVVQSGQQTFEFEIASPIDDGILCLVYARSGEDGSLERTVLVRTVNPKNYNEADILHRKMSLEENCDTVTNRPVSRAKLVNLNKRTAILNAHRAGQLVLADRIEPYEGGWYLVASGEAKKDISFSLLGGDTNENLVPLLYFTSSGESPIYFGNPPKHILLCVNNFVDDWHLSSYRRGTYESGSYRMGPQTLEADPVINKCREFVPKESQLEMRREWPNGTSLVPPETGGYFSAANPDAATRPTLAGLTLGMSFDQAVLKTSSAYPAFRKAEGIGKEMLDDTSTYLLEQSSPIITPDMVFENASFVMFRRSNPDTRIVLVRSTNPDTLGAVMILIRPEMALVKGKQPQVGSEQLIKDLSEAFGPPENTVYKGLYFDSDDEILTMLWSTERERGCWIEETNTPIMGTGGRSTIVEGWNTKKNSKCVPNIEVRYGRRDYNLDLSITMIDQAK